MEDLQKQLKEAKEAGDAGRVCEIITEILRPEARYIIQEAKKNISTKDGYGTILAFLPAVAPYGRQFLEALRLEGYPNDTVETLAQMI